MKRTPDWKLERYLLGELSETFTPNEADLKRLEELKKLNHDFLSLNPYSKFENKFKKQNIFSKIKNFLFLPKYSLALSLVLVLVLGVFFNNSFNEGVRLKGSGIDKLFFYKNNQGLVSEFDTNSPIQKGDLIQISFLVSKYNYGMIFSIDGNENVTMHYPESGEGNAPMVSINSKTIISSAYELDDAPSFETFYLVLSNTQFDIRSTVEAVIRQKELGKDFFIKEYKFEKN